MFKKSRNAVRATLSNLKLRAMHCLPSLAIKTYLIKLLCGWQGSNSSKGPCILQKSGRWNKGSTAWPLICPAWIRFRESFDLTVIFIQSQKWRTTLKLRFLIPQMHDGQEMAVNTEHLQRSTNEAKVITRRLLLATTTIRCWLECCIFNLYHEVPSLCSHF